MGFWTVIFIISMVSIFLGSPLGKAIADSIRNESSPKDVKSLENKINEQNLAIEQMKNEIKYLKDSVKFLERLVREQT